MCTTKSSTISHQLTIAAETSKAENIRARFFAYILIAMMPSEALPEVLHSLKGMWEFYNEKPLIVEVPRISRSIKATVVGREKREGIMVSD